MASPPSSTRGGSPRFSTPRAGWSLWAPSVTAPAALVRVVGRSRARLLTALDAPRLTTELARRLDLTAGAVSRHLSALRAAGLVSATHHGREVLYLRTEPAERLLTSAAGRAPSAT